MARSGNEPSNARSPLGLRLALACFGLGCGTAGLVGFAVAGRALGSLAFGVLAVVAALDAWIVLRHIRAGAHYQPGPTVPPYEPLDPVRAARVPRAAAPVSVRRRRYLVLLSTCLILLVLAWGVVRLYSTGWAVAITLVAMVIPPIAAVVANFGAMPRDGGRE